MSRAFLILTTQPAPVNTDPSERGAVLAARRESTVEAQVAAELRARATAAAGGPDALPIGYTEGTDGVRLRRPAGPPAHLAGSAAGAARPLTTRMPRRRAV